MPFTLTKSNDRKLVAVIGMKDSCIFIRYGDETICIDEWGQVTPHSETLEKVANGHCRTPVYSGEEVTIKFR